MNTIRQWRERLELFFFAEEIPYGIALIRICLPLVLLVTIVHRWPYAREIFSSDGATTQLWVSMGYMPIIPEVSGNLCVWLVTLLCLSMVTMSLGWCTAISTWVTLILYTYFSLIDSISMMTKYNVISCHLLLLLALSPCGRIWSIDAMLSARKLRSAAAPSYQPVMPTYPVWNRRLIQLLIALVYFGAASTKIQTPAFFNGDQMKYWMVSHFNFDHPLGELMSIFPGFLALGGFFVLVWELSFIFLVWRKFERNCCLILGVLFHLGTCLLIGLYTFPLVCFSAYLAFLDTEDIEQLKSWWTRQVCHTGWAKLLQDSFLEVRHGFARVFTQIPDLVWSPLMLAVLVPVFCTAGLLLEYKLDRFGLRRPEGPYHLKQLDPAMVQQMLLPTEKLREHDKVFSFDIGVLTLCDNVIPCRPYFKQGSTVKAQASLAPPHGDLFLECNLHTTQGQIITQMNKFVTREEARATFNYQLCDNTPPGQYDFVLKCNGTEVDRRRIEVLSNGKQSKSFSLSAR
jgi:hypothetical protein